MEICHFSDLHLALKKEPRVWQLLSKRALGYANLKLNRGKTHKRSVLKSLLRDVAKRDPGLVVVTGDFTSLSLRSEYEEIDRLFMEAGLNPASTFVIAGNHDRYTPLASLSNAFERGMERWLGSDNGDRAGVPRYRIKDNVVVIGLDTAIWRGPTSAAGRIGKNQIERLIDLLDSESVRGKWPVIALHHPPFHLKKERFRDLRVGLEGVDDLMGALEDRGATLIHGHLHLLSRRRLGKLDIIGVPSASNDTGIVESQAAYHTYRLNAEGLVSAESTRFWPDGERGYVTETVDVPLERWVD